MSGAIDFNHPWLLALLPLAALPLLSRRREALTFPNLPGLPPDRMGKIAEIAWRACAVAALLTSIIALAGLGRPEASIVRTGHGAEIAVVIDRSRSMDDRMLPDDWQQIDPANRLHHLARGEQKSQVTRELLSRFVAQRQDDRYSLTFFSTRPMRVVPFTQRQQVVQAGISAGGIGRGLSNTEVGPALLAAIGQFDGRPYSGSRIVLLVSDGGGRLTERMRERIRSALERNRVALYWIYLRSYNSPALDGSEDESSDAPAAALHGFFRTLRTPYRLYQAEVREDLARAVADVGRQQNLPLDVVERVPRQDYSRGFMIVAALACFVTLIGRLMTLRSWS